MRSNTPRAHAPARPPAPSILLLLFLLWAGVPVFAQQAPKPDANSNQAAGQTPTPPPAPTPIPLAEVITQAEENTATLEEVGKKIGPAPDIELIGSELPKLADELDRRVAETTRLLASRPSLETLRMVEEDWKAVGRSIPGWKDDLKAKIVVLDNFLKDLRGRRELWETTLRSLDDPAGGAEVPAEVRQTISGTIAAIRRVEDRIETRRGELLKLQTRISRQEARINETLESVREVREEALSHLLTRDGPPIWNARRSTPTVGGIFAEAGDSYLGQIRLLGEYGVRQSEGFVIHALVFILLTALLLWAQRRLRPMVAAEPELETAYSVFRLPVIAALLLSVMLSGWFYPQAPRILGSLLGAAALVPGIVYLRRILERPMFPILNALVVFYFVDQVRLVTAALPLLARFIFLAEMLGAVVFLVWFLRSRRLESRVEARHQRIFTVIRTLVPYLLGLFAAALVANLLGFVSLSYVLGNGVLGSSYIAMVVYAAVQIVRSLIVFALRVPPLAELGMVRNYPGLVKHKIFKVLKWVAVGFWAFLTLNLLSVREPLFNFFREWLTAELVVGSIAVSLSDLIIFAFTVWLAFAVSKLIRFVLAEDVYPRVELAGGIPYAISTVLHYVLIVGGFFLAIAALGVDLTKFTILVGALGVGIGFGLQNIVNNFVSGLILLFERPVKVDDVVQIGTHQGDLKRIGLRASVLRTLDGAEVIVPNGQLISEEVTNWTFSDPQRRLEINVGVAYGSDPRRVMELLSGVAREADGILSDPEPRTIFVGFGESSLDFQLRAWTDSENWVPLKSDLTLGVHDVLREAGIEIPFPQRDINLRRTASEDSGEL